MQTYEALAKLQESDPRLRIHSISTATDVNTDEIRRLTSYLFDRCPKMDHHNLALIRGDRKNPSLQRPSLEQYRRLYEYIRRLWAPRETGRYGSVVEPMLQWAKSRTAHAREQVIPCRAGVLSAVVYSNGDVSFARLIRRWEICARTTSSKVGLLRKRKLFARRSHRSSAIAPT
jgi:hypothetical protein